MTQNIGESQSGTLTSNDVPSKLTNIAVGWLAVSFPLLSFPEVVPPWGSWWVVALAIASLGLAIRLSAEWSPVNYFVGVLALTAIVAWARVADRENALSHFCGVAVGLLSMGTVALWCRTQRRLIIACAIFVVFGFCVMTVGLASWDTSVTSSKLIPLPLTDRLPLLRVPDMPGLGWTGVVNPNALAVLGLLITPVAIAFTCLPRYLSRGQLGFRLLGTLTCICVATVVVLTQSRSAWGAAGLTILVACTRLGRLGRWRLLALALALAIPTGVFLSLSRGDPVGVGQQSIDIRANIWRRGLDEFRASPWRGIGLNEFRHVLQRPPDAMRQDWAHAHNIFLQTALDLGFLGFVSYVSLLGYLLIRADQAAHGPDPVARRIGAGAGLTLVGVHFFGIADAVSLGARIGLFQWLASGLILAAWRMQSPIRFGGLSRFRTNRDQTGVAPG